MRGASYPERALAVYSRELARKKRASLPLDDLPNRAGAATIAERVYVMVCKGPRMLAVYRITPAGPLRRLRFWPKAHVQGGVVDRSEFCPAASP
jgi:hypothetical protein